MPVRNWLASENACDIRIRLVKVRRLLNTPWTGAPNWIKRGKTDEQKHLSLSASWLWMLMDLADPICYSHDCTTMVDYELEWTLSSLCDFCQMLCYNSSYIWPPSLENFFQGFFIRKRCLQIHFHSFELFLWFDSQSDVCLCYRWSTKLSMMSNEESIYWMGLGSNQYKGT